MEQLQIWVTAPSRREDPTPSQARSTQCPEEPGRTLPGHSEHLPFSYQHTRAQWGCSAPRRAQSCRSLPQCSLLLVSVNSDPDSHGAIPCRTGAPAAPRMDGTPLHWISCHLLWPRGFNAQSSKTHLRNAIYFQTGFCYYTNWLPNLQSLIYFHSLCRVKAK